MHLPETRKLKTIVQVAICAALVLLVAGLCYFVQPQIGYKVVALLLLFVVSALAMLFERMPVLLSAVLSAVIWNYFFIPPVFTFHIETAEDTLMFLLYFIVALINTVLSFQIRNAERKARDREEKEKTIRLYNTLLNSLSHELRTPIATVIGGVDTLRESNNLSTQQQEQLLEEISKAGLRLNRQVENLLHMSRIESGMLKLKTDWCDLNELIATAIAENSSEHNIVFDADKTMPLLLFDEVLMQQVIHNLIHNAVQHTSPQTRIDVRTQLENENCIITVADNGPGFPAAERAAVFTKFYRLPNSKPGGSGLGLSIVKGLTEAMQGEVELLDNDPGAKFVLRFRFPASYMNQLHHE